MYLCIYVFKVWWLTLAAVLCVSSHLSEGFQASRHVNRTHISKTSRMLHPTVTTSLPWQLLALLAHQFTCTNLHMNPRIYFRRVWTAVTMYPVIFDQLFAERHQPGNWFLHPVTKHLGELGIRSQAGFPLSQWHLPHMCPLPEGPFFHRSPSPEEQDFPSIQTKPAVTGMRDPRTEETPYPSCTENAVWHNSFIN